MLEIFIGIGIVISLIYYEITEFSPGGLISPVYLALFIDQPNRILGTVVMAIVISYALKALGRFFPLFGKRRFAIAVVIGILLKGILNIDMVGSFIAVGNIIPGLIAFECDKQGNLNTLLSLATVTILLKIILIMMQGSSIIW